MCQDLIDQWIYLEEDVGVELYTGAGSWTELKNQCRAAYMDVNGGIQCV